MIRGLMGSPLPRSSPGGHLSGRSNTFSSLVARLTESARGRRLRRAQCKLVRHQGAFHGSSSPRHRRPLKLQPLSARHEVPEGNLLDLKKREDALLKKIKYERTNTESSSDGTALAEGEPARVTTNSVAHHTSQEENNETRGSEAFDDGVEHHQGSSAPGDGVKDESKDDIRSLVEAMKTTTGEKQLSAVRKVRLLLSANTDSLPIEEVIAAGALPILVGILAQVKTNSESLVLEAAWAVTNIASGNAEQTAQVVDSGAIPLMVDLLAHSNADLVDQATWCLANVAGENSRLRNVVAESGAVQLLREIARQTAHVPLLQNVAWALHNVVRQEPEKLHKETLQCCIDAIKDLVQINDDLLKNECVWFLYYLSRSPPLRNRVFDIDLFRIVRPEGRGGTPVQISQTTSSSCGENNANSASPVNGTSAHSAARSCIKSTLPQTRAPSRAPSRLSLSIAPSPVNSIGTGNRVPSRVQSVNSHSSASSRVRKKASPTPSQTAALSHAKNSPAQTHTVSRVNSTLSNASIASRMETKASHTPCASNTQPQHGTPSAQGSSSTQMRPPSVASAHSDTRPQSQMASSQTKSSSGSEVHTERLSMVDKTFLRLVESLLDYPDTASSLVSGGLIPVLMSMFDPKLDKFKQRPTKALSRVLEMGPHYVNKYVSEEVLLWIQRCLSMEEPLPVFIKCDLNNCLASLALFGTEQQISYVLSADLIRPIVRAILPQEVDVDVAFMALVKLCKMEENGVKRSVLQILKEENILDVLFYFEEDDFPATQELLDICANEMKLNVLPDVKEEESDGTTDV